MRRIGQFVAVAVITAFAAGGALAQDAGDEGRKLYRTKTCVACHGKDGGKAIQAYPNLAGQDAGYLLLQMKDIKSGARVGGEGPDGNPRQKGMADIMHLVDDDEMKAIADWLGSLPLAAAKPATEDAARIKQGDALYKRSGCTSCHGPAGAKPQRAHPTLAGMKKEYFVAQMKDIRDGVRTNGKVRTMVSFAKKLNDEQIELLGDYLSTVQP